MPEEEKNLNGDARLEQKVRGVLVSEGKLLWGVIAASLLVGGFFWKIQMDIALIKQNHMAHIESIERQIAEQNEKYNELKQANNDCLNKVIDFNSKLDQLIGLHKK